MSENVFVLNRENAIIEKRIKIIIWYIIECYLLVSKNQVKYSKTYVKNNTSYGYKFENYLRTRFVDDYLNKNKDLLKQKTSNLNGINFTKESEEEHSDLLNNRIEIDKIDIYVSNLGLQCVWKEQNKNPYFAIECKRVKNLDRDITGRFGYISDIVKFCNRNHVHTRLPFEGQIAFIENKGINHVTLANRINETLHNNDSIITSAFLDKIVLNNKFDGTYLSKHKRSANGNSFSIYHLFFNYSSIIINE